MDASLGRLQQRIFQKKHKASDATGFFYLIKELGCLPDVIGREYEGYIQIWKLKILFKFTQRPMKVSQSNVLFQELHEHNKREEAEYKKANRKGRRK